MARLPPAQTLGLNRDRGPSAGQARGEEERPGTGSRPRLLHDSEEVLGSGSGGDQRRGLVPIRIRSRHLPRILEPETRKLKLAPLDRLIIMVTHGDDLARR